MHSCFKRSRRDTQTIYLVDHISTKDWVQHMEPSLHSNEVYRHQQLFPLEEKKLFNTYILTGLLLSSEVWHPLSEDLAKLETFQSRATKWFSMGTYKERLIKSNLLPISLQLQLRDLLLFNKLLNQCYDMDVWRFVSLHYRPVYSFRNDKPLFVVPKTRKKTDNFFLCRVVRLANYLHRTSCLNVLTDTPASFKRNLIALFHTFLVTTYDRNTCKK